ncbi:MAG: penicillin-binding transpeptidase domain-containing protein [Candidatus Aminicenantes bacterium]|nr:penicillin-binding transpeptidase domain-containing protein [Candidatus Aminicenantes bacterium]
MVLDYKDVAFSFKNRQARRRRQHLKLLMLALLVVAVFCGTRYLRVRIAVAGIQDLLLNDQAPAAGKKIDALAGSFFLRGSIRELRALCDLMQGRLDAARGRLAELNRDQVVTSLPSGRFQKYFIDRGEYLKLKIYTDYLRPRGGDEIMWYHALVQAAFFNGGESEKAVAGISPAYKKNNAKALTLLGEVNASLRRGRIDYIFDRSDAPLAYFDVRQGRTRSLLPGLDFAAFDAQIKQGIRFFRLTIDAGLQRKLERLFDGFYGSLLVLDLPENGILAAYSKPKSFRAANAVFAETYEPGSIIKIVTLLAYLRQADQGVFPIDCRGQAVLAGKAFYDWSAHGLVKDYVAALALSCNISFARMGLKVGPELLASLLELFRFNSRTLADWFLEFRTGAFTLAPDSVAELANLATGLGKISLTTVHAAMLASVFSQNGTWFSPYIIDDAKSILDLGFYSHDARPVRLLNDDMNFARVRKAMRAVVNDENGTGRRAWSAEADLAIKTGAAGDSRTGLDALVIGYVPAEKPRYAFAFRLEGGGNVALNGAPFLRELIKLLPLP